MREITEEKDYLDKRWFLFRIKGEIYIDNLKTKDMERKVENFLVDLYNYFREKYSDSDEVVQRVLGDAVTISQFAQKSFANNYFGIILNTDRNCMYLCASIPDDFRDDKCLIFDELGSLLEIHTSFKDTKRLWVFPRGSLGEISPVMTFTKDSKDDNELILEFLQKINEMYYSGKYDFDH